MNILRWVCMLPFGGHPQWAKMGKGHHHVSPQGDFQTSPNLLLSHVDRWYTEKNVHLDAYVLSPCPKKEHARSNMHVPLHIKIWLWINTY